jgi:hypothetical protein
MKRASTWAIVLIVWGSCLCSMGSADGCKFPERAIATMPSINAQSALVVYRDGIETLIIESTYDTQSKTVGWVLPLPAEPTDLVVADSGLLKSLVLAVQPTVKNEFPGLPEVPIIIIALALPYLLTFRIKDPTKRSHCRAVGLGATATLVLFLMFFFSPTLGGEKFTELGQSDGLTELSSQRVGNYDVTILKADTPAALSQWLDGNGLRKLDDRAKAIVADYIDEGWVFSVALLTRNTDGPATPHPIAATFPTDEPIYPMRLTALAETTMHLELFVIADQRAVADGLDTFAADRYNPMPPSREGIAQSYYAASVGRRNIGHPEAIQRMWPGCVVTRLSGRITPSEMDQDIFITQKSLKGRYRATVYSAKWKSGAVLTASVAALIVMLLAVAITYEGGRRPTRQEKRILLGIAVVLLLAVVALQVLLPVVNTVTQHPRWMMDPRVGPMEAPMAIYEDKLTAMMTDNEILEHINAYMPDDTPAILERSPGNIFILREDGKVFVCAYDEAAREHRHRLPE